MKYFLIFRSGRCELVSKAELDLMNQVGLKYEKMQELTQEEAENHPLRHSDNPSKTDIPDIDDMKLS